MLGVFWVFFKHQRGPQENQISNSGFLGIDEIRHKRRGRYRYKLKLLQLDINLSKPCRGKCNFIESMFECFWTLLENPGAPNVIIKVSSDGLVTFMRSDSYRYEFRLTQHDFSHSKRC